MTETMTMQAAGTLLTASQENRTLRYRLLPYGEQGRTNIGLVTASKGSVTVPADPGALRLNLEHDRTRPVGRGVNIEDTDEGLVATFAVARTRAGDDLLEEAAEGLRAGVSVEISHPVVRGGRLVAGELEGAGAVVAPAFPSALLVAADAGDLPEEKAADDESEDTDKTAPGEPAAEQTEGDEPDEEEATVPENLTASATVPAGSLAATKTKPAEVGKGELFKLLASAHQQGGERMMLAALSDIVPANTLAMEQPQYVGELWDGKAYQRKVVPLFAHGDLTSFEVKGWRWVNKPVVAPYAGNKTDVPSNTVSTEQVTINAERIAGAHDIDRKYRDFNDTAFFEAYFSAMTESYAKVSDAQVLADVLAAAKPVTRGSVPANVSPGMTSIVDGALAVLAATDTAPTFALVASDLYRDILLTRNDDTLAYLSAALGLEDGSMANFRLVPSAALTAGSVLVGARDAVTVHELGGGAPIRVEALDIARGGIDEGVFGYYAVNVHDADGLALVTAGV